MRRRLPLIGYAALALAVAALWQFGTPGSAHKIRAEAHDRCLEGKANRDALRTIISRGLDVGTRGTPGYDYYRSHPVEKQASIDRTNLALNELPPIRC